jgi:hypothetical protein
MRGIDAARQWFEAAGAPMLELEFGDVVSRIAVGRAGHGSECFGYDDEVSRDHDYFTGFLLWITEEDERAFGFRLERAYSRLRKEFPPDGESGSGTGSSQLGDAEDGVVTIGDFYRRHLGFPGVPENWRQWLYTPDHAFAEAVNGAVFRDDLGVFSGIRETIRTGMPEDVRRKKIAARAVFMAQAGQYNYMRCLRHGEPGAAALALDEFVRNAASMAFLLNRRFAPYYKWVFRAMRDLPKLGGLSGELTALLTGQESGEGKAERIEAVCAAVASELRAQGLSDREDVYLEPHAFAVQSGIRDREICALHIMEG